MESKDTEVNELDIATKLVVGAEDSDDRSSNGVSESGQTDHQMGVLLASQDAGDSRLAYENLSAGINIGQYELLSLLNSNSDSKIFDVRHVMLGKLFRMRILNPNQRENESQYSQMEAEIGRRSGLAHPQLSSIYQTDTAQNGLSYLVYDAPTGIGLEKLVIDAGALSPRRALHLTMHLCEAAMYLEKNGLTPAIMHAKNILVLNSGTDAETIKLADSTESLVASTISGVPVSYQKQIGLILLEMLSGKHPQNLDDAGRIANVLASFSGPAISLDAAEGRIRERLIVAAARTLRAPSESFVSVHEMLQELQSVDTANARTSSTNSRKLTPIMVASIASALLCVAGVAYFVFASNGFDSHTNVLKPAPPVARHHSQHIRDRVGRVLFEDDSMNVAGTLVNALQQNANLSGADLNGINLSGITLLTPRLANATFTNCHLTNVQLVDADLSNAKFADCTLTSVKFKRPTMTDCVFKSTAMNSISFLEAKLNGAVFDDCVVGEYDQAKLHGVHFRECEMDGTQFVGGRWSHCKFLSNMPNAKASFVLRQSVIMCDNLRGANFSQAEIEDSKISVPEPDLLHFKSLKNTTVQKKILK